MKPGSITESNISSQTHLKELANARVLDNIRTAARLYIALRASMAELSIEPEGDENLIEECIESAELFGAKATAYYNRKMKPYENHENR